MTERTLFISAGEASGDWLGSLLAEELRQLDPMLNLMGMGGAQMTAAGVECVINSMSLAIIGLTGIIRHAVTLRRIFALFKAYFRANPPALLILIDYPGFNLRLAKIAKQCNVPVFYYVSPQIWAWHYSRINLIRKYVDHMAVLFPFEKKLYDQEQVPATWVGHPLVEYSRPKWDKATACAQFGLDATRPILGFFPGSRPQEIAYNSPIITAVIAQLHQQRPDIQFVVPIAPTLSREQLAPLLPDYVMYIEGNTPTAISVCHAALAVSGTVTLEIALHQVPLAVLYNLSRINYAVMKPFVRVSHIGLCNLVGKEPVAREFIQKDATPEAISAELLALLTPGPYRDTCLEKLRHIPDALGNPGASKRAAEAVLALLESHRSAP